jgi:hypothetical protein
MFAPKGAHLLGLLSYDDSVKVHTAPTDNLDVFEDVLDDMAPGGCECIPFVLSRALWLCKIDHCVSVH